MVIREPEPPLGARQGHMTMMGNMFRHSPAPVVQDDAPRGSPTNINCDAEAQAYPTPQEAEDDEEEAESPSETKGTLASDSPDSHPWELEEKHRKHESTAGTQHHHKLSYHASSLSARRTRSNTAEIGNGFTHGLFHTRTGPETHVNFDGDKDPYNPKNWPTKKKIITTALYGFTTMGSTIASSIYASGVEQIASQYHVSIEVSTLGIALFLFGLSVGPLLFAPLSELYGRKQAVLIPYFIAAVFAFGTATAKDIQTILITRFFAGFFGSAPVTNTGGVLGDIWDAKVRGTAIVGYALAVIGGPTLGPIIGGAIVQSYLGWRWTEYLTGIFQLSILVLDLLIVEETYPPVLLVYKARRLRFEGGNYALHAAHEEWDVSIRELAHKYLIRPFNMLGTPICLAMAIYASLVYAIFYAQLAAFPVVYQDIRGWGQVTGALPFLALLIGIFFGAVVNIFNQMLYLKAYAAAKNRPVPEARLPPMMVGSILFTSGLFVFAWTCTPFEIPWIASCIGLALVGASFFMIFQSCLNYLVDTFQRYGASAVAANTFLRSMLAGAFPLFIRPMYAGIGANWAGTVLACVSILMIPIPFVFWFRGKEIRRRGVWSRESVYD